MNKKLISKFLLVSTLTLSLGAIAVSCHTKPITTENKTPETKTETSDTKTKNDTKTTTPDTKTTTPDTKKTTPETKPITPDTKKTTPETKPITPETDSGKTKISTENLNTELSKVNVNYPKKETFFAIEAEKNSFVFSGYDTTKFKVSTIDVTTNDENGSAIVSFKVADLKDENKKSDTKKITVSGFKALTKDHSNLTKVLFNDEKGFINLDQQLTKKVSLFKELSKKNTELILNFSSDKILIPVDGKEVNISKPETYIEVGSLTPTYKSVYNSLISETTKLLSESFKFGSTFAFNILSNFLKLPKEEAIRQFNLLKEVIDNVKFVLSKKITFIDGYFENVEKLINRDNYSLVYNPKTGLLAMQTTEAEIDLSKPETFANLVEFQPTKKEDRTESLKDKILVKIKEVLKANGVDASKIDLFLNDENSNISFILQKNGTKITTGLKVKLNPKN